MSKYNKVKAVWSILLFPRWFETLSTSSSTSLSYILNTATASDLHQWV